MTDQDWVSRHARSLGVFLNGKAIPGKDEHGRPFVDDSFLLLFNGAARPTLWSPSTDHGEGWRLVVDTERLQPEQEPSDVGGRILTRSRAVAVLQLPT
jgi:glycogen operon protein